VTKSTFVVLIAIVNATSDQSGSWRWKKMGCVCFATLLSTPNGMAARSSRHGHDGRVIATRTGAGPSSSLHVRFPPTAPNLYDAMI
jgi:hypothetical protein